METFYFTKGSLEWTIIKMFYILFYLNLFYFQWFYKNCSLKVLWGTHIYIYLFYFFFYCIALKCFETFICKKIEAPFWIPQITFQFLK